ncbi:condensation domain-containing protein [Rhodococcus sp. 14-2483-1-2]|uniref:condensation domain-containing protein n=1 Tax=Rhodococcus sp. 14-2483-1-2 TaxID=2023147 RepID=UPI000B9C15CE|nr:condensation domain-containing protein [Rhodococcus sp. 14-2483-1-2]OZF26278.1 hypothetical protein CH295_27180 [Rhodococcus sp. 14-2483-1-2]
MSESNVRALPKSAGRQHSSRTSPAGVVRVPLSLTQQAVVRAERSNGPARSHTTVAWEIAPAPDHERLERACVRLLENAEILRTVYPMDRRLPYQQVVDIPTPLVDVVDVPYAPGEPSAPFDLATQIPVRMRLHPSATGAVLALTVHRIAADEASTALIAETIARGYNSDDEDSPPAQYRDFSAYQIRASAAADDADLTYWTDRLSDAPAGFIALATNSEQGEFVWERVLDLPCLEAVDPTYDALTATAIAVHREWGVSDISIGVLDAARESLTRSVIGNFANHLICRIEVDDTRTRHEVLAHVTERLDAAREHDSTRIERVGAIVSEESRTRGVSPFQVVVEIRPAGPPQLRLDGHRAEPIDHRSGVPAGVDLAVSIASTGDGWAVWIGTSRALRGVENIEGFIARFRELLDGGPPPARRSPSGRWAVVRGRAVDVDGVESALAAMEGVAPAVVEARRTADDIRLDAYVTGNAASADAALDALRTCLPAAAVPATVTGLARLPLTASGDVDRDALPEPEPERQSGFGGPARTATEEAVVAALRDVLALDENMAIGREDSFFGLGGDSLAALRLVSALKRSGFVVEAHMVFAAPVVAELAAHMDSEARGEFPAAVPAEVAPMATSGLDEASLDALRRRLSSR